MNKLENVKKLVPFVSFLLGIFATVLFLVYLAFETNSTRSAVVDTRTGISYVLINEDLGGTFNGMNYNFGAEFVSLVNQDVGNDWQTSSRGVAEAGFAAGNFDVMIILPQHFTEGLLSIESFNPEAVQIDYAVRLGQNEITNALVHEQVSTVLDDFNQRIIQMYFSSILGILYDAQFDVSQLISDESIRHHLFMSDIEAPFAGLPFQFSDVVNDANFLSEESDLWMSGQNLFNEQAQEMLTQAAEGFSNQLTDLESFIDRQNIIANRNYQNAQFMLREQSQIDEGFYHVQFSDLNQSLVTSLNLFNEECHNKTTICNNETVMRRFMNTGEAFQNSQNLLIFDFENQIESLEMREKAHGDALRDETQKIMSFRDQIANIYFGDKSLTPETVSDENIRNSISNMITMSEETGNELAPVYLALISDYLTQIAPDDLVKMLSALYEQTMITTAQYEMYEAGLAIISRFADEEGVELNQNVNFAFIEVEDVQSETSVSFPHTATFMIEPLVGELQFIHLNTDSDVRIHDIEAIRKVIEADMKKRISQLNDPIDVEVTVVDDQTISVYIFKLEGMVPEFPIELTAFNITVQMELIWYFSETELETSFITKDFEWLLNDEIIFSNHLSKFVSHYDKSLALVADLSVLLDQLSLLENASRQIVTLFGAPTATSQTILGFKEDISDDALTMREHAPYDSIYQRYGTLTDEELDIFILESLVPFFREQGTELFNELNHRYEELISAMNVFYDGKPILAFEALHNRMMPGDSLLSEVNALHTWQLETRTELESAYENWQQSEVLEMELREHLGGNIEESAAFNFDITGGEMLVGTANTAVTTLENNMEFIETSLFESKDLSDRFTSLINQTEVVSTQVEQISNNLVMLSTRFNNDISANESFSDNFSRVMENARIGGADNQEVLGFLASPVDLQSAFEQAEATSIISLYLTIIASMVIVFSSYGFRSFESRKEVSKEDELVSLSLPILNKVTVLQLLVLSILVGLLFGIVTRNLAGISHALWILWMASLVSMGILVVTYFSRQLPRFTLLISTVLIVSYLLLTPFLGVEIEPGTLVAHLFNASPLLLFENLVHKLKTGEQVRIIVLPMILLISTVGVVLNLYVKVHFHKETKDGI